MVAEHGSLIKKFATNEWLVPSQANPAESYAARWAAREACRKALGGIRDMRWHDVRVDRAPFGFSLRTAALWPSFGGRT